MTIASEIHVDPRLDLEIERVVDVSPEVVWAAWTKPEHLKKWFTPAPWKTVDAEIDLRPGGLFCAVMQSPEGERFPNVGCYLEVVPGRRLTWTNALEAGFRPAATTSVVSFRFTAAVSIEPHGGGTRYRAVVRHADEASRTKHDEMGFADGWGKAWDQLVDHAKRGEIAP